jgi:hypothetical protein
MLLPDLIFGQALRPTEQLGIIYNRETTGGLLLHTHRGWGATLEFGRIKTYYKTTTFSFSISELKHPKEYKQSPNNTRGRAYRSYIFGKQNNLIAVRAGWGVKKYLSEKAKQKGVAVGYKYEIGPTLGILKPYYLALSRPDPDNPGLGRIRHEKYSADNADLFLDTYGRILGASPFFKGLGESGFTPGGHATLALHFDWGAFDEVVKALEIGAMVDVFATKTPILVSEQNNRAFLNFFLNLQFGKRC